MLSLARAHYWQISDEQFAKLMGPTATDAQMGGPEAAAKYHGMAKHMSKEKVRGRLGDKVKQPETCFNSVVEWCFECSVVNLWASMGKKRSMNRSLAASPYSFSCALKVILEIAQSNLRSQLLCGVGGQSVTAMT